MLVAGDSRRARRARHTREHEAQAARTATQADRRATFAATLQSRLGDRARIELAGDTLRITGDRDVLVALLDSGAMTSEAPRLFSALIVGDSRGTWPLRWIDGSWCARPRT